MLWGGVWGKVAPADDHVYRGPLFARGWGGVGSCRGGAQIGLAGGVGCDLTGNRAAQNTRDRRREALYSLWSQVGAISAFLIRLTCGILAHHV